MKLRKRINYSLLAGLAIMLFLLTASIFPRLFTNNDPYATQSVITDNTGTVRAAPFPPGTKSILGSDELGRDLYTLVIYGARLTLKTVVASVSFTLFIAFIPGLVAGFGKNICSWLLKVLNITFSTVPAILFCMIILRFPFLKSLPVEKSLYAFALVIAIVEAGRTGIFIQQRVEEILKEPFIEGAVVIGKNPAQIAFQNVLPHLVPGLIVFISLEAARILFIMCQLAVFNVVAGNINYDAEVTSMMGRFLPYEPEWSSMLGTSLRRVMTHTWVVIPPLFAFFISILSFNLLAEGLRIEFEKKNSHFITLVRKGIYLLSPKAFIYDVLSIRRRPLRGLVKLGIVAIVAATIAFPRYLLYNSFDADKACANINEISNNTAFKQNTIKDSRDRLAAYIAKKLGASGLTPAGSDRYYYDYTAYDINYFSTQKVAVSLNDEKWELLKPVRDFKVVSLMNINLKARLSDKLEDSKDKILIMNDENHDYELMQKLSAIDNDKLCKAVLLIKPNIHDRYIVRSGISVFHQYYRGFAFKNVPVIEIDQKTGEKLLANMDAKVSIQLEAGFRNYNKGKNIYAVIPGTDEDMNDQYIVIGSGYDFTDYNMKYGLKDSLPQISAVALNLELADAINKMGPPKKTIIFAFWDFHGVADTGAIGIKEAKGISSIWNSMYIDLQGLYPAGSSNVVLDLSCNSPGMLDNQRMVKYLKNELIHMGLSIKNEKVGSSEAEAALYNGFGSIIIEAPANKNADQGSGNNSVEIDRLKIKKIGQALVNAIEQSAY